MTWAVVVAMVIVAAAVAFVVVAYRRRWKWAGFAAEQEPGHKTVWDWLQLLVIPLGLAAVAFALNAAQSSREQRREDRRTAVDRQIAADRRREDALSTYLQQMSDLMLQRKLARSLPKSDVRSVARTLTLTVLPRLDGKRKAVVVKFLSEAGLITPRFDRVPRPTDRAKIVEMWGADLRGIVLHTVFDGVDLEGADMRGADFRGAALVSIDLESADVRGAHFNRAYVEDAEFRDADLRHADFGQAHIVRSSLDEACVTHARFHGVRVEDSTLGRAVGHDVDLSRADLGSTDLRSPSLTQLNLSGTKFESGGHPPTAKSKDVSFCFAETHRSRIDTG
jgi:uncharacterized protein YjbI with pentapeptide repeats